MRLVAIVFDFTKILLRWLAVGAACRLLWSNESRMVDAVH